MKLINRIIFVLTLCVPFCASAQEYLSPMSGNINLLYKNPVKQPSKNSNQKITVASSDTIPFFEDFYYAPNSPYPTGNHWTDSSVYINTGFGIEPTSIGVATFDGLDKNGYPYNIAAIANSSSPADFLTSKNINMYTKGTYTFSPADSMGMSFFYQAAGFGENPTSNDSLVLDFYKPLFPVVTGTNTNYGAWSRVWSKRGNNTIPANDTLFKRAFVRISDTAYFHDGFRFRFRNRATGAGSADHWNVDYIEIKPNYAKTDSIVENIAFVYVPRPMLKNYSSMPWNQYQSSEMGKNFSNFLKYTGTNTLGVNCSYVFETFTSTGTLLNTENKGAYNIFPFTPTLTLPGGIQTFSAHANPLINYTISPLSDTASFIIKHYISATTAGNNKTLSNDTVYQRLEFNNFYAYDDGSAEMVYGHGTTIGPKDALKFVLNVTDTLRALDIFFDPFIDGNFIKNSTFRMYVWSDGGGLPGTVLRKDSAMKPVYLDYGYNKIPRYFFTTPMILGAGTYYIGMQTIGNQSLCVGFDRNVDHHTKLYYDVGSGWTQSSIKGSLMIHPVFGEATRALVGIKEQDLLKSKEGFIKVYPNPATDKLFIAASALNSSDNYTLELYSMMGAKLSEVKVENTITQIDLNDYASGIYFVTLKQNNYTISNQKFIISH